MMLFINTETSTSIHTIETIREDVQGQMERRDGGFGQLVFATTLTSMGDTSQPMDLRQKSYRGTKTLRLDTFTTPTFP